MIFERINAHDILISFLMWKTVKNKTDWQVCVKNYDNKSKIIWEENEKNVSGCVHEQSKIENEKLLKKNENFLLLLRTFIFGSVITTFPHPIIQQCQKGHWYFPDKFSQYFFIFIVMQFSFRHNKMESCGNPFSKPHTWIFYQTVSLFKDTNS